MRLERGCQWWVCGALLLCACSGNGEGESGIDANHSRSTTVYVVNYPLQYFAQRIAGDLVEVVLPAPVDVDPAYWSPDAVTIADYQQAALVVLNGAGYAQWVNRASLSRARSVDTSVAFQARLIRTEEEVTHQHGPEGKHAHGAIAFTTWLDPGLAIEQARAITEAFIHQWPEHEPRFQQGFASLERDLLELDARIVTAAVGIRGEPLLFSHPIYQYFIRRYELNAESLHWEPDEMPTAAMWRDLDTLRERHPARWMIWEGEPSAATVAALGERDVESVVFDPCANVPDEGDYLAVMDRNVARLEAALSAE